MKVSYVGLLFLVGVVVALVLLGVVYGRRAVALGVLAVAAFTVIAGLLLVRDRIDQHEAALRLQTRPKLVEVWRQVPHHGMPSGSSAHGEGSVQQIAPVAGQPWRTPAELGFEADVYPCPQWAVAALAKALVKEYQASLHASEITHVVVGWRRGEINGNRPPDGLDLATMAALVDAMHRCGGDWKVETYGEREMLTERVETPGLIGIAMDFVSKNVRSDPTGRRLEGHIRVRLAARGFVQEKVAAYLLTDWVSATSAFVSAHPEFSVGFSSSTATDAATSYQEALMAAAGQIAPSVRAALGVSADADSRPLVERIARNLQVKEQFSQKLALDHGGTVVRTAVLVDVPATVTAVVGRQQAEVARGSEMRRGGIVSAAVLLLLVCGLGAILNVVTKGYYHGRVVIACMILLVVATAIVMA